MMLGGMGTDINAPVVTTHWWCPVPGQPVSYMEQFFGCPSVNGYAPYGAGSQPSSAAAETILSLSDANTYAPVQAPPVATSPTGPGLTVPPASGADAQATIDALIAQQNQAWKDQNAATMAQTSANLKAQAQSMCPGETLVDNGDGTWSCPGSGGMSLTTLAMLAAGGIVAMLYFTNRR